MATSNIKQGTNLAAIVDIFKSLIADETFMKKIWVLQEVTDFEASIKTITVIVNASATRAAITGELKHLGEDKLAAEVAKFVIMCEQNTNMEKLYQNSIGKILIDLFNVQPKRGVRIAGKRLWGNVLSAYPDFCCSRASAHVPEFKPSQGGAVQPYKGALPNFLCHHANLVMGLDGWSDKLKDLYVRAVGHYNNWYIAVRVSVTPVEKRPQLTVAQVQQQRIRTIQAAKTVFTHFPDAEKQAIWNFHTNNKASENDLLALLGGADQYDPITDKSGQQAQGHNFYLSAKAIQN